MEEFDLSKLAYCGLYCDLCSIKVAYEEKNLKYVDDLTRNEFKISKIEDIEDHYCECCKGYSICGPCDISDCASAKNIVSCADCEAFPCEFIHRFAHDGMPHHNDAYENLKSIRELGVDGWVEEKLSGEMKCSHCGERQSWYYKCPERDG